MTTPITAKPIPKRQLRLHDATLIGIMGVLAMCGLIYEYLLSHYAARVLGAVESTIFAMIGIMIVAMGVGAYSARWFKQPFTAFAWLEALIALIGMTVILVIAGLIALTKSLPHLLGQIFNLPPDFMIDGDILDTLQELAAFTPYIAGFLLGAFIGMEIPLIARARQSLHAEYLANNVGTIYGADYIGAGIGAALWVMFLLSMDISTAALITATVNILAGWLFILRYAQKIQYIKSLVVVHILLVFLAWLLMQSSTGWMKEMTNILYKDQVVFSTQTNYQYISITERQRGHGQESVIDLYLNGRLQFSSLDEHIYHHMLVYPAMAASRRHQDILIIGGGDGLALRNILRWNPRHVTLIDLDPKMIELFSGQSDNRLVQRLAQLNEHAYSDPRVTVITGDAFIEIEPLLNAGKRYDTIIVDLPDPNHPDLNKLYSVHFYERLKLLLQGDGALSIQSTSPYHAKKAFQSIGKTVSAAKFAHVEQYRQNVPSFGEWGWTIATKQGKSGKQRLAELTDLPVQESWVSLNLLLAAFEFPANYYHKINEVKINTLGSGQLYQYHYQAWQKDQGIFKPQDD